MTKQKEEKNLRLIILRSLKHVANMLNCTCVCNTSRCRTIVLCLFSFLSLSPVLSLWLYFCTLTDLAPKLAIVQYKTISYSLLNIGSPSELYQACKAQRSLLPFVLFLPRCWKDSATRGSVIKRWLPGRCSSENGGRMLQDLGKRGSCGNTAGYVSWLMSRRMLVKNS